MSDDTRPHWKHKTPEGEARWLLGHVVKITHHWEMTGPDTSKDWITLHKESGEKRNFPTGYFHNNPEFSFSPNHASLITERPFAGVLDSVMAIDAWETKNAADRQEFERLKAKFAKA